MTPARSGAAVCMDAPPVRRVLGEALVAAVDAPAEVAVVMVLEGAAVVLLARAEVAAALDEAAELAAALDAGLERADEAALLAADEAAVEEAAALEAAELAEPVPPETANWLEKLKMLELASSTISKA